MYRRKKRFRSNNGGRVQGPTAGVPASRPHADHNWQQQEEEDGMDATSLIQLNPISSTTLSNHADLTLVHNPYYLFTDPTYCLTNIGRIERGCLAFHRQVFSAQFNMELNNNKRSKGPHRRRTWTVFPIFYNGPPLPRSKLPLSMGASGPHLIRGFLGPAESTSHGASRSVRCLDSFHSITLTLFCLAKKHCASDTVKVAALLAHTRQSNSSRNHA